MVAEYQPQKGKYYYYTTDQIGSTRLVTDDVGNMVYAAAHDPYGGVQQTWVNTFNPKLKFSGKEQDAESALYYFGARYYDPALYRFLSPDPVIPTDRALYNPQRWNLHGYCLGNPINYYDLEGASIQPVNILIQRQYSTGLIIYGTISVNGIIYGPTYESGIWYVPAGTYQGRLIVGEFVKYEKGKTEVYYAPAIAIFDKDGKRVEVFLGRRASIHEGSERSNLFGCIAVPKEVMDRIVNDLVTQVRSYILSKAMQAADKSILLSGLDQVFMAWYALDLLSLIMSPEIRQRINDSMSMLQINIRISSAQ